MQTKKEHLIVSPLFCALLKNEQWFDPGAASTGWKTPDLSFLGKVERRM